MKKTILYDEHIKRGARMVSFAGSLMPLEYSGIKEEHLAVRRTAGLFDVSHMGQIRITGKDANRFVNYLLSNLIPASAKLTMHYAFLLYENGGVVDDLMVYAEDFENYLLVVNASNKTKDYEWIKTHQEGFDVRIVDESEKHSQLALQGPLSEDILQRLTDYPLSSLKVFNFDYLSLEGRKFMVSRNGYTGEDGFEIYGSSQDILALFVRLLNYSELIPCGLGCRDTLRFEAGMPLYGHEISEEINPLEAGLDFAVKLEKDFIGASALRAAKEQGLGKRIVAIELLERGIAREGYQVRVDQKTIGMITTGYLIPGHEKPLAFALLLAPYTKIGTEVFVQIRKNEVKARVRNKRFLKKKYNR